MTDRTTSTIERRFGAEAIAQQPTTTGATWDHDSWRESATCRNADTEMFFPEVDKEAGQPSVVDRKAAAGLTRQALALCAVCPVRIECLEFSLRTRQLDGIWGGLTEEQRRSLRRRRQVAARRDAAASLRKSA